jgi:enoyl-CoA hydratase
VARLTYATLRYEVADGIATIAMDQPDTRNALSDELLGDLIAAFEAARDDAAVRCVVLASTHATTFSSGTSTSPPSASRGCSRSSASSASR